jgi:rod shape-determining protein MreC
MESFFSRYRNLIVLLAALLLQVIGLAVQVRRPVISTGSSGFEHEQRDGRGVLLIRSWAASLVTPFERVMHESGAGISGLWNNYANLRRTQQQNRELQQTIDRLRLEQAELREDALQGQRLQAVLKFRENYAYQTIAAQVIGSSGSIQSHLVYLDKGSADGLAPDMAVVTGDGIVGKVRDVFPHTSQVLLINDQTSGAGVILETTRIRGILRGNAFGQPQVINILADNRIQPGEHVLTAGGDQIFPRGLPVGVVEKVTRDPERGSFINVVVKSAADLQHLDEVLVITSLEAHLSAQQQADLTTSEELKGAEAAAELERKKAAAEMAERLPSLHDPNDPNAKTPTPVMGPDGKPLPVVPVTPKPIPALHPDRFSPGGASDTPNSGNSEATPEAPPEGGGDSQKPATPKSQPAAQPKKLTQPGAPNPGSPQNGSSKPGSSKPDSSKPTAPKAPQFSLAIGSGRMQ